MTCSCQHEYVLTHYIHNYIQAKYTIFESVTKNSTMMEHPLNLDNNDYHHTA